MQELKTTKQMLEEYHISRQTFRRRRIECSLSPYKDAIIQDGPRKIYIDDKRWREFLKYRSNKYFKELYGITDLRNSSKYA